MSYCIVQHHGSSRAIKYSFFPFMKTLILGKINKEYFSFQLSGC